MCVNILISVRDRHDGGKVLTRWMHYHFKISKYETGKKQSYFNTHTRISTKSCAFFCFFFYCQFFFLLLLLSFGNESKRIWCQQHRTKENKQPAKFPLKKVSFLLFFNVCRLIVYSIYIVCIYIHNSVEGGRTGTCFHWRVCWCAVAAAAATSMLSLF